MHIKASDSVGIEHIFRLHGIGYTGGVFMAGFCGYHTSGPSSGKGSLIARIAGVVLMITGIIILLAVVPRWFWTALAAILIISAGYLIWRFAG